jgi:hypothetical protein
MGRLRPTIIISCISPELTAISCIIPDSPNLTEPQPHDTIPCKGIYVEDEVISG